MLAIKFHHIRTLIHRPYLCYPHLRGHRAQALEPEQHARVRAYGDTCVAEARAIARLMYDVGETSDVVLDYPWWQMISCLVCAGSVLVLAETTLARSGGAPRGGGFGVAAPGLGEDIETLVRVLQALSGNSDGARLACGMMESIRARSARISVNTSVESSGVALAEVAPGSSTGEGNGSQGIQEAYHYCHDLGDAAPGLALSQMGDVGLETDAGDHNMWPMVIPDWMNWNNEFLETFQSSEDTAQGFVRG